MAIKKVKKAGSMQDKFITMLTEACANNGFELTVNYKATNAGVFVVVHPDTFRSLACLDFSFHANYCEFEYVPHSRGITGGLRRYIQYQEAGKLADVGREILASARAENATPVAG